MSNNRGNFSALWIIPLIFALALIYQLLDTRQLSFPVTSTPTQFQLSKAGRTSTRRHKVEKDYSTLKSDRKHNNHPITLHQNTSRYSLNMSLALEKHYCRGYKNKKGGPPRYNLSSDEFLMFHIGKAGGNTARKRLWQGWNLNQ